MELTRQLIGDVQNQRPLDHMLKVSCLADFFVKLYIYTLVTD